MAHAFASEEFHRTFAAALFDPTAPVPTSIPAACPSRAQSGFAIYRNNVIASLIKAVGQRYPVVRRLAGEESFDSVAHQYVLKRPPQSPVLIEYGADFAQFVRSLGPEAIYEYLADVAVLEWLRGRAYHAAEVDPVSRDAFASLVPERLDTVRLQLHPSVSLLRSRFPVVTVWESGQDACDDEGAMFHRWGPECALVARPFFDVQVWRLTTGGYAFIQALGQLATLSAAATAGLAVEPEFNLADAFTMLIESGIVTGFAELTVD
jgi:hypothetical protein